MKKIFYLFFACVLILGVSLFFGFQKVHADLVTSPSPEASPLPSEVPSSQSTDVPTALPTEVPTATPTVLPTDLPTPTLVPTVVCQPLPIDTGVVTTTVTIGTSGTYSVWSRIMAPNTAPSSYYLQVDNQCGIMVGGFSLSSNVWTWINYADGNTNNKIALPLTQGTHVVKLIGNTLGLGLDRVIFTADMTCLPTGFGNNCNQVVTPTLVSSSGTPTKTITPAPSSIATPTSSSTTAPITTTLPLPTDTPAPTATPVPGTQFAITVLLHGIGHGGDNVAPNSEGNKSPIHIQRIAAVEVFDSNNNLVASPTGTITFDPQTGTYKGIIDVGQLLPPGAYITKIIVAHHLNKSAVKIVTITAGEPNPITLDSVEEVAGDLNGDGKLDIADFNIILNCVSDLGPAKDCSPAEKEVADINDDGVVNLADLNLYFREISVQSGQ